MAQALVSKRKATAISNGVFLIGLAMLIYTGYWWPGILLVVWANLFLKQYLTGRVYDATITSVLLLGLVALSVLNLGITALGPILLVVGGIYIIFREYTFAEDTNGEEKSEEIKDDMNG